MTPHSMVLCMVGTGMLWVGWYGFNAGSAVAPTALRPMRSPRPRWRPRCFVAWAMAEYLVKGKPRILGFCSGAVGGWS